MITCVLGRAVDISLLGVVSVLVESSTGWRVRGGIVPIISRAVSGVGDHQDRLVRRLDRVSYCLGLTEVDSIFCLTFCIVPICRSEVFSLC